MYYTKVYRSRDNLIIDIPPCHSGQTLPSPMLVHPDLGRERSGIHYTNQVAEHKAPGLLDERHCTHLSPMHVLAQYKNTSSGARKLRAFIASMPSIL